MTLTSPSAWLAQEELRLSLESPRVWSVLLLAKRFRLVLLMTLAGLAAGYTQQGFGHNADTTLFVHGSRQLLSTHGLDVFSNPAVQVGPLYLLPLGLVAEVAALLHIPVLFADGFVEGAALIWICIFLVRLFAPEDGRPTAARDIGVGTSLILGPLAVVAMSGHFEDPLIAAFFLLAANRVARGHGDQAAMLIALATGFKLWGLLGLPILLLGGSFTVVLRRGLSCAACCAATYLPFFLGGRVGTFDYTWTVEPSATLGLFMTGHEFGWTLRLVQGLAVVGAGALLARRPRSPVWLLPTAIIAVRLLLDPKQFHYYWAAPVVCLVVGWWAYTRPELRIWLWPTSTLIGLLAVSLQYLATDRVDRVVRTAALIVGLAVIYRPGTRTRSQVGQAVADQ